MVSDKGTGIKYVDPTNKGNCVRVMPGKPHSPFPYQQKPYVVQMKEGKAFDRQGNLMSSKAPEVHIPLKEFTYKN